MSEFLAIETSVNDCGDEKPKFVSLEIPFQSAELSVLYTTTSLVKAWLECTQSREDKFGEIEKKFTALSAFRFSYCLSTLLSGRKDFTIERALREAGNQVKCFMREALKAAGFLHHDYFNDLTVKYPDLRLSNQVKSYRFSPRESTRIEELESATRSTATKRSIDQQEFLERIRKMELPTITYIDTEALRQQVIAKKLQELDDKKDKLEREIEELNMSSQCIICRNDKINLVYVPCGHCSCEKCYEKISPKCSQCRLPIKDTVSLFV